MKDSLYKDHVPRCDLAATKRSILRYLRRYERDWERTPVWVYASEMDGCAPPEEGNAVMTTGRVRMALGQLVREGQLQERRTSSRRNMYALTALARVSSGMEGNE